MTCLQFRKRWRNHVGDMPSLYVVEFFHQTRRFHLRVTPILGEISDPSRSHIILPRHQVTATRSHENDFHVERCSTHLINESVPSELTRIFQKNGKSGISDDVCFTPQGRGTQLEINCGVRFNHGGRPQRITRHPLSLQFLAQSMGNQCHSEFRNGVSNATWHEKECERRGGRGQREVQVERYL